MTIGELYRLLNERFPFRTQYRWDRSGLTLNGKKTDIVKAAVVALDFDRRCLDFAVARGANVVVCHHPVFAGKTTRKLLTAARRAKVSFIAMHSNFDKSPEGMNYHLAKKLGLLSLRQHTDRITMLGELPEALTGRQLALLAKRAFGVNRAVYYPVDDRKLKRVAVLGGGGAKHALHYGRLGIDVFVTGDVGWHAYRDAHVLGFSVLDVGHQAEMAIVPVVAGLLEKNGVKAIELLPADPAAVF